MRLAWLVLAGCSGGWKPVVVGELADPQARPIAFELDDGANGTEAILALFAQAKATGAGAISGLEIQVGACTRELAPAPRDRALEDRPELDRITLQANETRFVCEHGVEQVTTAGSGNLRDTELADKDACRRVPVDHVVTRYRFELDHRFAPPDVDELARTAHVRLVYGPPRCGGESKLEVRARFHRGKHTAPAAPPRTQTSSHAAIAALVERARAAAQAHHPGEATQLAEQALATLGDGSMLATLDDARATELAGAIAAAHFYAVEMQVDRFLRRAAPRELDAVWADDVAADLDRIAKRYERMKDLVRLPVVTPWLRAGAARLGDLHAHLADLLDRGGQPQAAASERAKARLLVEVSQGVR